MNQKLQITRGAGASEPAVKRHFMELIKRYGSTYNVNLLATRENSGESLLGSTYLAAVKQLRLPQSQLDMYDFDLHAECRGGSYENVSKLMGHLRPYLNDHGYFLMDSADSQIICKQTGVFRTNCMDCLDRTNLVQNEISRQSLQDYVEQRFPTCQSLNDLYGKHSHLWAENGDSLSKIYAGTGALKSAFTRTGKVTFMNVLSDATRSANRFFINNFQDKAKQEVIDQLLVSGLQKRMLVHG